MILEIIGNVIAGNAVWVAESIDALMMMTYNCRNLCLGLDVCENLSRQSRNGSPSHDALLASTGLASRGSRREPRSFQCHAPCPARCASCCLLVSSIPSEQQCRGRRSPPWMNGQPYSDLLPPEWQPDPPRTDRFALSSVSFSTERSPASRRWAWYMLKSFCAARAGRRKNGKIHGEKATYAYASGPTSAELSSTDVGRIGRAVAITASTDIVPRSATVNYATNASNICSDSAAATVAKSVAPRALLYCRTRMTSDQAGEGSIDGTGARVKSPAQIWATEVAKHRHSTHQRGREWPGCHRNKEDGQERDRERNVIRNTNPCPLRGGRKKS